MTENKIKKNKKQFTKVLTFGVFDYFHYGHFNLFKQAKEYGDYLIVAIQIDEEIKKRKPNSILRYSYEQRSEIVKGLRIVDEVYPSIAVEKDISKIDFDILALGEDQNHDGFKTAIEWCKQNNKRVVKLKRWQGISSTQIKQEKD